MRGRGSVGVLSDWVYDQFGHGHSDRFSGLNAWDVVGGVLVGAVRFEFTLRGISCGSGQASILPFSELFGRAQDE